MREWKGLAHVRLGCTYRVVKSQVFDHKGRLGGGTSPGSRVRRRDEEDENTKHGGGVCLFRSVISSGPPCDRGEESA